MAGPPPRRSRSYINGVPVPPGAAQEPGPTAGQRPRPACPPSCHQARLPAAPLDGYAGHHLLLDDVRRHHQQWRQLQNELNRPAEQQQREACCQLIEYQAQGSLDEFALAKPGNSKR